MMLLDMRVSYHRVSELDLTSDRPWCGCMVDQAFEDVVSTKNRTRPNLEKMLKSLEAGDELYVRDMATVAINIRDLYRIVKTILSADASIIFDKENLKFVSGRTNPCQSSNLELLESIYLMNNRLIHQRQREGIEIAKKKGKFKGRQSRFTDEKFKQIREEFKWSSDKVKLAEKWGISRAYLYKIVKAE